MFHPAGSHHSSFQPHRLFPASQQPAVFHLLLPPSSGDDPPPSLACNPALNLSSETHTSYSTFNLATSVHKSSISLLSLSPLFLIPLFLHRLPPPCCLFWPPSPLHQFFSPAWKSQIGGSDGRLAEHLVTESWNAASQDLFWSRALFVIAKM